MKREIDNELNKFFVNIGKQTTINVSHSETTFEILLGEMVQTLPLKVYRFQMLRLKLLT